ncbi:MAG: dipeptidyl aminopeptidase/acylaminoacyl peptidase [Candidatus Krumholzibacteriia bacterium]|jgi:dipeptidyl aminopeptidase/acylaminoacyl peptidase
MRAITATFTLSVGIMLLFHGNILASTEAPEAKFLTIEDVLVTDIIPLALPAFYEADRAGVTWDDLLQEMPTLPGNTRPRKNGSFAGRNGDIEWHKVSAADGLKLKTPEGAGARYLAFYVTSDRWQKVSITVRSDQPVLGAIGTDALSFTKEEDEEEAPTSHTAETSVMIGTHLIILRSLYDGESTDDWALSFTLSTNAEAFTKASTKPGHSVDIETVLDAPRIGNVSLSADGALCAISLSEYRNGKDRENWIEVRDTKSGDLVQLWRGDHAPGSVSWHPHGHRITWQINSGDTGSLHTFDFESGETEVVLADVAELGSWQWAPDGKSIVYSIDRSPDADPRKVKRVMYLADRQPWWRGRSHLMQTFVPSGVTRRLSAGPVSADSWEISPDGSQMLFFTSEEDLTTRPYYSSELWLLNLESLAVERVFSAPEIGGATWSPDGKKLLLQGSPSAFDGLGRNLPEGVQANDYGGQLYLYDLASREPSAMSLNLRPDVSGVDWSKADGMIYARTTDTQYNNIYRSQPGAEEWTSIPTGLDVTGQINFAADAQMAVARGSGATSPFSVHLIDLKKNTASLLLDPGTDSYRDVVFGKVENWVAELDKGMAMDGFVYYPPGFDPDRKYPVIVYYYGGTSPITRDFGGRYPKNVWAGQDYIVYVPNPSGATGYGQEYAARHVNDWGKLTAPEVIEGTRKFLAAHPFTDSQKVGCMGASYGGFLTEYIITQTDLFAAAVSHAGISDISSYWGEGMWGYAYGARALAHSFPWQDRELFVEQSALFHADKITTPLLLVHGDTDINVPKGESDQLFTALKMLGKDVEYVQIVGQGHHILDHDQRIVWNNTIMAYLAKYLKDRPDWWNEMYPDAEDYR